MARTDSLAERVRAARAALGLSQAELAARVGIKQPSLAAIETGETRRPRFLLGLARALGVTPEWLENGDEARPGAPMPPPAALRDLPVYASAEGGPGELLLNYEVIEWATRPPPLMGVANAFAMYVIGESMQPVYRPGDILLIHPGRPPRPEDDVVAILHDRTGQGFKAMVKRLRRMGAETVQLHQFNPPPGQAADFELARADLQHVYPVVGSYRSLW